MVNVSASDLAKLAIGWGVANFLLEGKLERPIQKATKSAITKAAPAIGRAVIRYGPAAVSTAARVTPTGAVVSTAGLLAIQNREKIAELAAQGYQVVAPAAQQYAAGVAERVMDPETFAPMGEPRDLTPFGIGGPIKRPTRKRLTKFNSAVKRGMQIVKNSTSYGKKGTINNAKKAFTAVTKAASAVSKGRKAPKSGIRRKLHTAMSRILPKKKKTRKKTTKKSKIDIKVYKK